MEETVEVWKVGTKDWEGPCVSTPEANLEHTGCDSELNYYPKP